MRLVAVAGLCAAAAGCAAQKHLDLAPRTGGSAFLFRQFQAFDGRTGRPLSWSSLVRRCRQADVVLFGEEHNDAVCNQLEAQLLYALLDSDRPLALAMEFFEADTQPTLDAYLTGRIDEPDFLDLTARPPAYLRSHRPLIELCRAAHVPVIAANAPRRLVRDYRASGLSYAEFRARLDPQQRRWLPAENAYLAGPYRDRFARTMQGHAGVAGPASQPAPSPETQPSAPPSPPASTAPTDRSGETSAGDERTAEPVDQGTAGSEEPDPQTTTAPASEAPQSMPASAPAEPTWHDFYQAQLLWDEALAESVAGFRRRFPRHRVMLVVGSFHVAHDGGTTIKLHQRRPHDRVCTLVYHQRPDPAFAFNADDRHAGEIVVYGLAPPEPERRPASPATERSPGSAPASQPATAPTTSQPGSAPATQGR